MWWHIRCITSDAVSCGGYLGGPTRPARHSRVLGHGALGSCWPLREGVWVTAPGVPWVHMRHDFNTFAALLRAVTVPFPSFVGLQVNKEVPTNESKQTDQSHRVLRGRAEQRQDLHLLNCIIPHIAQNNSVLDWCNMAHPLQNGSCKDGGWAPLSSWHDTICSTCSPYAQAGCCFSRQASCGADTPSSPRQPALSPGMVASHQRKSRAVLRLLCRKRQACLEISASPLQLSALHCLGPQAELSPRHAWQKLEGSQVFWPLELIFSSSCSKYVFNRVHSAIQAEEII